MADVADGMQHFWKAGDVVVLPKGWSGRWDIAKTIRTMFATHKHGEIQECTIRAVVKSPSDFEIDKLKPLGRKALADWGDAHTRQLELFSFGRTVVGSWFCPPGGWQIVDKPFTEFIVLLS